LATGDQTFFLHHYEASPYAEKIRAMFGLIGGRWGSVLSPPYPPRPNVDPLAGGYRRIPVAQIGADIFCDTTLIATEVAEFSGHSELAPDLSDPDALALVNRAEGDVFFAAITSVAPLKLLGTLLLRNGPFSTMKFVRDRAGMMKGASVRPPQGDAAARLFDEFLADLDTHLGSRESVDGDQISYADFCAYHPIWLALSVGGGKTLRQYANVCRWRERMEALGHGDRQEMSAEDAFDAAAGSDPRSLPTDEGASESLGGDVTIAPSDYGKIGVQGKLVAATDERYVLLRDTERFGAVHVHFPREGYDVFR
jgi:glutathione S-transferase